MSIFDYLFVLCIILSGFVSTICVGANRIRYGDVQAAKEAKRKGKVTKKAKDILTKALVEDAEEVFDY